MAPRESLPDNHLAAQLRDLSGSTLTESEAGQATQNLMGFVRLLAEIDRNETERGDDHASDGSGHRVRQAKTSVTGFAEGETGQQTEKYVGGKSTMNLTHYFGPCTPAGAPHHYTFTLIATDLEPTALQPGMTRDEVMKALDGHAQRRDRNHRCTFSKP